MEEWTSIADFEAAIAKLPSQFRHAPKKAKSELPDERFLKDAENNPGRRVYKFYFALRNLYQSMGGLHVPNGLTFIAGRTPTQLRYAFHQEIDWLWLRRWQHEPISSVYSKEYEINYDAKLKETRNETRNENLLKAREKLEALQVKAKIMGPKKKARFEESKEFLEAKAEVTRLDSKEPSNTSYENYANERKAKEVLFRKSVNELLPQLSGEEYFDAIQDVIRAWLLGVGSDKKEEVKRAFEDALLEWALNHANDAPVIRPSQDSIKDKQPITEVTLKPMGRRLLEEIHRVRPIISGNPSLANIKHAQLLLQNFNRVYEKMLEEKKNGGTK